LSAEPRITIAKATTDDGSIYDAGMCEDLSLFQMFEATFAPPT